ncbi:hypothetical protein [Streptomyces sp. NPDC090025]|uniref:hypothetical protein n=1 Tax=Streptomyces sp. NPDC090025 TaxID=3365922 RepID=UPI003837177F
MDTAPGPAFLTKATPLLLESQQLTRQLVSALSLLSTSSYTAVAGSRSTLDTLAGAVSTASLASTHLAQAIALNPLDGMSHPGPAVDEDAIRQARQADAQNDIADCLAEAMADLDLAATCCTYGAGAIVRDLAQPRPAAPATGRAPASRAAVPTGRAR